MDEQGESVVRDQAGGSGIHLVQAGWRVNDHHGDPIGKVVARDKDFIHVEPEGGGGRLVEISTRLIAEEDESARLATLTVDRRELQDVTATGGASEEPPPLT